MSNVRRRTTTGTRSTSDSDAMLASPVYANRTRPAAASSSHSSCNRVASKEPVEHQYSLYDSRNAPWATLKVASNVSSARLLPSYFEGQTIAGKVELNFSKPETIQAVTVTLSGTIVATNANPFTFWALTQVLWSTEMGDPRGSHGAPTSSARGKSGTKLCGAYSWPFSVVMPGTCSMSLSRKQPAALHRLPPSFSEKGAAQFINYEINVRIKRGPLRVDSKLGTQFGYAPRLRPPSPSWCRRIAYDEDSPLVGPDGDPDGWEIPPPIPIRGRVFGARTIEATLTFAIALPLMYTRGSPIPCMLTVACADAQALDHIFAPASTSVHLIREVAYDANRSASISPSCGTELGSPDSLPASMSRLSLSSAAASMSSRTFLLAPLTRSSTTTSRASYASSASSSASAQALPSHKIAPKLALRHCRTAVASAVWWPASEGAGDLDENLGQKRLEGEIMLPRDAPPSFTFGGFSVKYSVVLLPFHTAAFEPTDKEPILLANIDVATLHTAGPLPRSYAPPGAEVQQAAHLGRVLKPMVWGLYNTSGPSELPP